MTLHLIVNADDYGRSAGISRGIRDAHQHGIVTSTTCMMNFATTDEDIALALRDTPQLGLGVHLVLTSGRPLLPPPQIPTLTAATGTFHDLRSLMERLPEINPAEAQSEWRAQIEKFMRAAGRPPTHLDAHHHAAYFTAGLFRAMLELAQEYGCAIRLPTATTDGQIIGIPDYLHDALRDFMPRLLVEFTPRAPDAFYATFYDQMATRAELLRLINNLPAQGVYEIMCHPGYADEALIVSSVYARQRENELAVLTDSGARQAIIARAIQPATFAVLG
ncbi:MAG: ChbG/HpnK family deacetylase [Anaerolinea sp.]|nr:ChbG/HpnK family deacetylase [Anaerolinea sp.]